MIKNTSYLKQLCSHIPLLLRMKFSKATHAFMGTTLTFLICFNAQLEATQSVVFSMHHLVQDNRCFLSSSRNGEPFRIWFRNHNYLLLFLQTFGIFLNDIWILLFISKMMPYDRVSRINIPKQRYVCKIVGAMQENSDASYENLHAKWLLDVFSKRRKNFITFLHHVSLAYNYKSKKMQRGNCWRLMVS